MKRFFDIVASVAGLLLMSPVLLLFMLLIWLRDFHSPFYASPRAGRHGKTFTMIKLRSMIVGADKTGVDSTGADDKRITWADHIIRRYKLDEFSQLWNVLRGDMSFVGPRPNVLREVALYTEEEQHLLDVLPGITDFSSIVFSDENDILKDHEDPDIGYNQLIRPWKSRLGLIYVEKQNVLLDLALILLTVVAIISREYALWGVNKLLNFIKAPGEVIRVAEREDALVPFPSPGSDSVVTAR